MYRPAFFGQYFTVRVFVWTDFKALMVTKSGALQYEDDGGFYAIWFYDGPEVYQCTIWKGAVPEGHISTYSQEQNDLDLVDFEENYKATGNGPIG